MLSLALAPFRALGNWAAGARCRRRCVAAEGVTFTGETRISNPLGREAITVGAHTLCMGQLLVIAPRGRIRIGEWCYIGPGSKLWSMEDISVGNRVFVSHGVSIFDNNSHSFSARERHERFRELRLEGRHLVEEKVAHRPVAIGDDAWIGFSAAILKGVTIGKGAIVGACSVITHDVPDYAVVVGSPARQVGSAAE